MLIQEDHHQTIVELDHHQTIAERDHLLITVALDHLLQEVVLHLQEVQGLQVQGAADPLEEVINKILLNKNLKI